VWRFRARHPHVASSRYFATRRCSPRQRARRSRSHPRHRVRYCCFLGVPSASMIRFCWCRAASASLQHSGALPRTRRRCVCEARSSCCRRRCCSSRRYSQR
jgi:hypothetical protein